MLVEDSFDISGGTDNRVSVLITLTELDLLLAGHVLTGANMRVRKNRVRLQKHSITKATEDVHGLVMVELKESSFISLRTTRRIVLRIYSQIIGRFEIRVVDLLKPTSLS